MNITASIGEIIDKYSILELKLNKITNEKKLEEIRKELLSLSSCITIINSYINYYNILLSINQQIWEETDVIKNLDSFHSVDSVDSVDTIDYEQYAKKSKNIFDLNQKRFRVKNIFNNLSDIKEQKSYINTYCKIIINSHETFIEKIPEIMYLSLEYDVIILDQQYVHILNNAFPLQKDSFISVFNDKSIKCVDILNYSLKNDIIRKYYEPLPISYISSGLFGDFIHQLSIINEKYYETGRRGLLYITDNICAFRNGVQKTFDDTYNIIIMQKYILDYKIWNNELYDINLSIWRTRQDIFDSKPWSETFNFFYNVDWCKHPWLVIDKDINFAETVFINTVSYRDTVNINYNKLYELYGESLVFITNNIDDYIFFKNKRNIDIPVYIPKTLTDTLIAIASCNLFIGTLSGHLTLAHACNVRQIIGLVEANVDNIRVLNMDKIIKNATIGFE